MKLTDILLDRFIGSKLFEMAFFRKDAKNQITSLSPLIFDHLLKLFVLESPENKNHWINEIDTWLRQIDKIYLKPYTKKPSKQDLYNWILFDSAPSYCIDYIDNTIRQWKRKDYKEIQVRDFDKQFTLNKIFSIIERVAKDISINKFETIEDYLI